MQRLITIYNMYKQVINIRIECQKGNTAPKR